MSQGHGPVERLDAQLEVLRHSASGLYGPALRAAFQQRLGWPFSPVHYRLLRIVEAGGELRPSVGEVAASLLTDKARASRLVDQLVAAGLLRRLTGRLDRRRRELELTGPGRAALAQARAVRLQWLAGVLADWDTAEVERLAGLLDRLNTAIWDEPLG